MKKTLSFFLLAALSVGTSCYGVSGLEIQTPVFSGTPPKGSIWNSDGQLTVMASQPFKLTDLTVSQPYSPNGSTANHDLVWQVTSLPPWFNLQVGKTIYNSSGSNSQFPATSLANMTFIPIGIDQTMIDSFYNDSPIITWDKATGQITYNSLTDSTVNDSVHFKLSVQDKTLAALLPNETVLTQGEIDFSANGYTITSLPMTITHPNGDANIAYNQDVNENPTIIYRYPYLNASANFLSLVSDPQFGVEDANANVTGGGIAISDISVSTTPSKGLITKPSGSLNLLVTGSGTQGAPIAATVDYLGFGFYTTSNSKNYYVAFQDFNPASVTNVLVLNPLDWTWSGLTPKAISQTTKQKTGNVSGTLSTITATGSNGNLADGSYICSWAPNPSSTALPKGMTFSFSPSTISATGGTASAKLNYSLPVSSLVSVTAGTQFSIYISLTQKNTGVFSPSQLLTFNIG